ncbi:AraC-like ligand-binding domain-containing protein [Streptomyces lancefieldiae]|uniref:Helix-turn-helix domain-containing protein n=1 Tax=Streptomyces lancefieldiae TaxID=3075520 RepID=A0ABU3AFP0_9ACTN|nr:helix-turn-helix domain-containing protein [Streptomyces sp. DSM 40712]MDT0608992.1 helix-turn-helix domain-containing protein [Streptomyces sp. DSM 40712]
MRVTEFSTETVRAPERFALWEDTTARSHMRNRLHSRQQDDFRARMRVVDLGELQVSALAYPHLGVVRSAKVIRQSDPEVYQINYFLNGEGTLSTAGGEAAVRSGELVVMDSSRPYRGDVHHHPGPWSHVTMQCPRRMLPLPEKTVQRLLAVPLSGRHGMGGTFARWLTDLTARAAEHTPADGTTLASVTVDLLASLLARNLEAEAAMDPQARRRALLLRIRDFIQQNLADPRLSPETVAAAHDISTRHLYALFRDQGVSVAAWIRERRLECCRRALTDPSKLSLPIQAIAARWGFPDPAHFSRTFREAYGMPPRDYRHAAVSRDPAQRRSTTARARSGTATPASP